MKIAGVETICDASVGLVQRSGLVVDGPVAGQRPFVEAQPRGQLVELRLVQNRPAGGRKVLGALIPDIILRRLQAAPIGGRFEPRGIGRHQVVIDAADSGLGQQSLKDHLGLFVRAFAEVTMPNKSIRVDEIKRRPIMVIKSTPYGMVVVDRDRVADPHVFHGPANVVQVFFECELWCVNADHHQSLGPVFSGPGADIGKRATPVDAGVGPEIDQNDFPAQSRCRQGRRIEPFVCAFKRGQLGLARKWAGGQPMKERNSHAWGRGRLCHVHITAKAGHWGAKCGGEHRGYQEPVRSHR